MVSGKQIKAVKSPVASPGFSVMFLNRMKALNNKAIVFTIIENKLNDQNMSDCVFEIPDDASTTEDSGSPVRNIATGRKTAHVESRSIHDVPDLRAMLSGRVYFVKRPGRASLAERGIAIFQSRTVSSDTKNI